MITAMKQNDTIMSESEGEPSNESDVNNEDLQQPLPKDDGLNTLSGKFYSMFC